MRAVPKALWLALAGAALQVPSLFTDFYVFEGVRKSAWFGVPQTSELVLLAALVTAGLAGLIVAGRSPLTGKVAGWVIGILGSLAVLQLAYRMIAPPFGAKVTGHAGIFGTSCLYYCLPSQALPADLLPGIWTALAGSALVALGGTLQALWPGDSDTSMQPWRSSEQHGMSPWLGLAALGAIGQFVFGYTFFTFYTSVRDTGPMTWSGWLPSPHTAWLVFLVTIAVLSLATSAARERAPFSPRWLGIALVTLGAISVGRIAYRIYQPPFRSDVEIGPAAYLALISALVILVAGFMQASMFKTRLRPT